MSLLSPSSETQFKLCKEGISQAQDELDKDGVIQRFEFTFELLWKALKIVLEGEGIECLTPKDCLKSAFRIGLVEDEQVVLDMLEDRNKTSHIYAKQESEEIFKKIKEKYSLSIKTILDKLQEWQKESLEEQNGS